MATSGSYEVKQGNIFGRVGESIGKALSEQVPKEMERSRLSSGLKALSGRQGLSPFEQFAELSGIPGITPQMIESGAKLLKNSAQREAYNRNRENVEVGNAINPSIADIQFGNLQQRNQPSMGRETSNVSPNEMGQPQINQKNPLREEAQPKLPWTPSRRDEEISKVWNNNPNLSFEEAASIAADNEKRDMEKPAALRAQDEALNEIQKTANDKFTKNLELKLQKSKEGVFNDISGEMINNLQRGMERDLRTNPKATVDDVVNDWTNRALDLAKAKTQMNELASGRSFIDNVFKSQQTFDKLKSYGKIFEKAGNQEEFYNILKSPEGFNMSPQGAAYVAYDRSPKVDEYIKKSGRASSVPSQRSTQNRKRAVDIENILTSGDSLLAIAKDFKIRDPYFDERSFFSQLREDQDRISLSPRQRRELGEAESEIFPDWGDIWVLPTFKGHIK
jgi:hypothetical protein